MSSKAFEILAHPLAAATATTLALNIALWLLALVFFPNNNPAAILHYNALSGVDFIGTSSSIITLPLIGFIIIIVNGLLAWRLKPASARAVWLLWGAAGVVQVILIVAVSLLWRLNL